VALPAVSANCATARLCRSGDRIIYYSSRERMRGGEPTQAFTAIGELAEGEPEPFDMGRGFVPYRRAVRFYTSSDAPIRPLLPLLSFSRGRPNWGMVFRRGIFAIDQVDYHV
jgi:EVE domain